ncbi:hypothetical protein BGZ65_005462, partial [Modicella reniformis]
KDKAHQQRQQKKLAYEPTLEKDICTLEKNSHNGKWTPRKTMKNIAKGMKEIHFMTEVDKKLLEQGLRSCFDVCRCATEADTCIGCHKDLQQRVAISGDSDLLNLKSLGHARNLSLVREIHENDLTSMFEDYLNGAELVIGLGFFREFQRRPQ